MVADPPTPSAFPQPQRGPMRPPGAIPETERHLRGIATVLGKLSADLPAIIGAAADTEEAAVREIGGNLEASIDQVGTEISDLTAAVRELTELVKEMAVFPRTSTTRRVIRWCSNR